MYIFKHYLMFEHKLFFSFRIPPTIVPMVCHIISFVCSLHGLGWVYKLEIWPKWTSQCNPILGDLNHWMDQGQQNYKNDEEFKVCTSPPQKQLVCLGVNVSVLVSIAWWSLLGVLKVPAEVLPLIYVGLAKALGGHAQLKPLPYSQGLGRVRVRASKRENHYFLLTVIKCWVLTEGYLV